LLLLWWWSAPTLLLLPITTRRCAAQTLAQFNLAWILGFYPFAHTQKEAKGSETADEGSEACASWPPDFFGDYLFCLLDFLFFFSLFLFS
jgi:hypothetical protein